MDVSIPKSQHKTVCRTEYGTLQKVILCKPEHMTIKDVINETQKHFEDEQNPVFKNLYAKVATSQHLIALYSNCTCHIQLLCMHKPKNFNISIVAFPTNTGSFRAACGSFMHPLTEIQIVPEQRTRQTETLKLVSAKLTK